MPSKQQFCNSLSRTIWLAATAALAIVFVLTILSTESAQAQTYTILHSFTGGQDGGSPFTGLTMDRAGNLYGTTMIGGITGVNCPSNTCGTVFKLARHGSGWIFNPLYSFAGGNDGANPYAGVVFGPNGSLYGTTPYGGGDGCGFGSGCGTVFNLKPSATACKTALCYWTETLLYGFTGGSDGAAPAFGNLIFDSVGHLYGTTLMGGDYGAGTVFELTPSGSGWTETTLYSFTGGSDGGYPWAGLTLDNAGNLYGTTELGGTYDGGTVFQLTPSGLGWTENVLHSFPGGNDGDEPYAGLIFDQSGSLYGATVDGGQRFGGTAFKLTPSNGSWTFSLVYSFQGSAFCGPTGNLIMDAAANLYGTTECGGAYGKGAVFKLTLSGGAWRYTTLHDFTAGNDGANPVGGVVLDASGNVYSTAGAAGANGQGVVFEITP